MLASMVLVRSRSVAELTIVATEIYAPIGANGSSVALKITPGRTRDGRSAEGMLDGIDDGQVLLADRAYS